MPLHPEYELARLRAEWKKISQSLQQRRDFMHALPADAKDAISAHCGAINAGDKELHALADKIKAKEAECAALKEQPAEEAQPAS